MDNNQNIQTAAMGDGAGFEAVDSSGFSETELAKLAQWAQEDGWEQAQVEKETTAEIMYRPPMPDAYGGQVAPQDYQFTPPSPGHPNLEPEKQVQARNILAEMGVPLDLGNEFVRHWNGACSEGPLSESELLIGREQCRTQLEAAFGSRTDEVIAVARKEVANAAKRLPWLLDVLGSTKLGNDSWLIGTLYNIAEARKSRGSSRR